MQPANESPDAPQREFPAGAGLADLTHRLERALERIEELEERVERLEHDGQARDNG
ncbi:MULTISPECIES: hypothetical protein [unclassified Streptomyces]|uniref:hypothetical protein n=1 Tax=unclassified Streptomyces TaxID=2593676 RepID=UPI001F0C419F|nr:MULTISPECIES: hypothetical protein [unclassified Streptomyces]